MKTIKLLITVGILAFGTNAFSQTYPLVTIRDIQESPDLNVTDVSPLFGDTVRVEGIVATGPRSTWAGARWTFFLVDTNGGPWSSIQIIQHDTTTATGMDLTFVPLIQPGFKVIVTGVVDEFDDGTQIYILLDPLTPLEFIDQFPLTGTFPQVVTDVTMEDLQGVATGEQWEATLVKLSNVKMLNNDIGSGQASIGSEDGAFQLVIEDWNLEMSDCLFFNLGCEWPPNGRVMNIVGYIRDRKTGDINLPRYLIAPWSFGLPYIDVLAVPPAMSDIIRSPGVPATTDEVEVTLDITDDGLVVSATLSYSVDNGPWQEVAMANIIADLYFGIIPEQAEGSLVKYFVSALDDSGLVAVAPGDTTFSIPFYTVRNGPLSIQDIQINPFGGGSSGYDGIIVTTTGIVTSDTTQFDYYWIQNGNGPWSGLQIRDFLNKPIPGDEVQVKGTITEFFGFTEMVDIEMADYQVLSSGNQIPEPRVFSVGTINTLSDSGEAYEGVLVEVRNVLVTDELPDAPDNNGEFEVGDITGKIRVDDLSEIFDGNDTENVYGNGDSLGIVRGYLVWSFNDFKIAPRKSSDITRGFIISVREEGGSLPNEFKLSQNYPNPFNPETELGYSLPVGGEVKLTIYNLLGQRVASIVDQYQEAGNYRAKWNGRSDFGILLSSGIYFYRLDVDNGKFSETRKMLLLK